jgi:hypothetical protein
VEIFLVVAGAFALIMAAMAVGVLFSDRPLRGSCGGPAVLDAGGNPITCPDCNCDSKIDIDAPSHFAGIG